MEKDSGEIQRENYSNEQENESNGGGLQIKKVSGDWLGPENDSGMLQMENYSNGWMGATVVGFRWRTLVVRVSSR